MELFTRAFNAFTSDYELPTIHSVASDDYYKDIDPTASDNDLKVALKNLLQNKTTVSYDGAWYAFAAVDKYLPGYPCSSDNT